MKNTILALLTTSVLFASSTVMAAKCKYDDDSVDKFTNVRTVSTDWRLLMSPMAALKKAPKGAHAVYIANAAAWFEGDDEYLMVRILLETYIPDEPPPYELENAIVIPEDAHLLALMADGSIVQLPVSRPHSFDSTFLSPNQGDNSSKNDYLKSTEAGISYVLDEDAVAALTSQDATNMRIEAGDTYYDIKIHKKSMTDVAEVIECMQQAQATEEST